MMEYHVGNFKHILPFITYSEQRMIMDRKNHFHFELKTFTTLISRYAHQREQNKNTL